MKLWAPVVARVAFNVFIVMSVGVLYAEDENPEPDSIAEEAKEVEEDTRDSYSDSFTTGDVVPAPPPEGEPDTTEMDSRSPDEIVEDKMREFEELQNPPSRFEFGLAGALEFPHVLNYGVETLFDRKFGISLNTGNVSRNVTGVDIGMRHYDIRFRYHPWAGSFFGGIALGQHTLNAEKARDIVFTYNGADTTVPTKLKVTAKSNYVAPHIGWFSIWEGGFTMGLDMGVMVPTGATSSAEATFSNLPEGAEAALRSDPDFQKVMSDIDDATEAYTKKILPFLTMIRVGWMF